MIKVDEVFMKESIILDVFADMLYLIDILDEEIYNDFYSEFIKY